jgi:hypothetical protein
MAITKKSYIDLKEYWDYQRKIEYNKEIVHYLADKFKGRVYNDFGMVSIDEMKKVLWERVKSDDFEEPKKGYVPKDPKLRIEGEGEPHLPTHLLPYDKDFDN